jgi:ATP-dependent DNA helicase RecG
MFKSTPTQFQTTIFASTDMRNVGNNVGNDVGNITDGKLTERQRNILNAVMKYPTITGRQMSEMLSVSQRTIERDLSYLQNSGILKHEGKVNDGAWVIMKNSTN